MGWQNPRNNFVFHYFLKDSADNKLVVQRGRLEGWGKNAFNLLVRRISKFKLQISVTFLLTTSQ